MFDQWKTVRDTLHDGVDSVFPGAVLLVGRGDDLLFQDAVGSTACPGTAVEPGPVRSDTVFDLASLTKPIATAAVVAALVNEGSVGLDDTVAGHLPGLEDTDKAALTVRQLLAHTSGLPAWMPWGETLAREHGAAVAGTKMAQRHVMDSLASCALEYPAGFRAVYSDVGFVVLGLIVRAASNLRLDAAFSKIATSPLGLKRTFFVPVQHGIAEMPPVSVANIAATEACPTRGRVIKGEVHDDNAWVLGGVAGHAGLFGTARDVWMTLRAWLDAYHDRGTGPLTGGAVRAFWDRESKVPGSTWVLGFDTPTPGGSSAGAHAPDSLVGHLGFTGTSSWMEPESEVVVVLLTNRVNPTRDNNAIKWFRPRLHDAVWEAIGI